MPQQSKPEDERIGTHRFCFDGEIVTFTVNGEVSESDLIETTSRIYRHDDEAGNLGIIAKIEGSYSISPDARKYLSKATRKDRPGVPMAVLGISTVARAFLFLVMNAIRLVRQKEVPMAIFSTENEARAWLKDQMDRRKQKLDAMF
ncbi:MAG TPA: STAS/SEC14 domain-containing protein [Pseudomonadota bacterium]|nr:STAS/SEC14 domain-containing protein [Pseudomonadota bacterium]